MAEILVTVPSDYNFSGNGIVYGGERMPSPKMQDVKYNYQNISIEILQDRFIVQNKNLFVDTAAFDCVVLLEQEGKLIREAGVTTDVKPGCSGEFVLPFKVPEKAEAATEYAVIVSFRLKKETFWAEAGHEIAFGQRVWQVQGTPSGKCGGTCASENSLVPGRKLSVSRGTHNSVSEERILKSCFPMEQGNGVLPVWWKGTVKDSTEA